MIQGGCQVSQCPDPRKYFFEKYKEYKKPKNKFIIFGPWLFFKKNYLS